MVFYIDVVGYEKLLSKLKKHPLKKDIVRDIDSLQINPFKGKYLSSCGLFELKYPNLRIYYIVEKGLVVLFDHEYEGVVFIVGKGNKNSQKRDIGNYLNDDSEGIYF